MRPHIHTTAARKTGWVTSELYFWHDTQNWSGFFQPSLTEQPGEHFENAEMKRRLQNLVNATGLDRLLVPLRPEPAADTVIADWTCHGLMPLL